MNASDDDLRSSSADLAALKRDLAETAKTGEMVGKSLVSAFEAVAFKGKSVGDAFNSLALSLSQAALKAAFQPLEQGVGSLFRNLLGSGGNGGAGFPFSGNATMQSDTPIPVLSSGGLVNPFGFALDGLGTGSSSASGSSTGLSTNHGGNVGAATPSVVIHIATPDIESFRRSETQVAAQLARAVSLGQRNL